MIVERTVALAALGLFTGCLPTPNEMTRAVHASSPPSADLASACSGESNTLDFDFTRTDYDLITVHYCSRDNAPIDWLAVGLIGADGHPVDLTDFGFANVSGCGENQCNDHACQQDLCRRKPFCDESAHQERPSTPSPTLSMMSIYYCSITNAPRDFSGAYPAYTFGGAPACGTNQCTNHSCVQTLCR